MRAKKGSSFERTICKQLSSWWSLGLGQEDRSDIFWRSSQSGGRATQRTKKGLTTFGSYGDIAAVDPIGAPLIKMFTIELKRGSSYSCAGDLLDFKTDNHKHVWAKCLQQAIKAHEAAGSEAWLLVCKRDHRIPIAFLETKVLKLLLRSNPIATKCAVMRLSLVVSKQWVSFVGLPFETFLEEVKPEQIIKCLKDNL